MCSKAYFNLDKEKNKVEDHLQNHPVYIIYF